MTSTCRFQLGLASFVLLCVAGVAGAEPLNFQHFFPNFDNSLRRLLRENCTEVYGYFVDEWSPSCEAQGRQFGSCRASRVIDCLSDVMPESWKTNMSSATVLLGILPAALVLLGSNTPQVSLLALRRPILAFVLAVGTPGVTPTRALQYADHLELLERRVDVLPIPSYSSASAALVTLLEYLIALGAVANVIHITWQLCILTVCSFSPEAIYMPALWVATSFLVNVGSYWAAKLRTRVVLSPEASRNASRRGLFARFCADEFSLSSRQEPTKIKLRRETYFFITISWVTSLGAIGNLILGTLTLSGLQYIGVRDSMVVIARYFASAIACRVVLDLEIAGMRGTVDIRDSSRFRRPTMDAHRMQTMDSAMTVTEPFKAPRMTASGSNPHESSTDNTFTERNHGSS